MLQTKLADRNKKKTAGVAAVARIRIAMLVEEGGSLSTAAGGEAEETGRIRHGRSSEQYLIAVVSGCTDDVVSLLFFFATSSKNTLVKVPSAFRLAFRGECRRGECGLPFGQ